MKHLINIIGLFVAPLLPLILICFSFSIFDTFTGMKAAKKRGEEITSRKVRLGLISKLITYFSVVVLAYIVDYFIVNEITRNYVWFDYLFTKIFTGIIIYIEALSIDENIKVVRGYSFFDKAKEFLIVLRKTIAELMRIKQQ